MPMYCASAPSPQNTLGHYAFTWELTARICFRGGVEHSGELRCGVGVGVMEL